MVVAEIAASAGLAESALRLLLSLLLAYPVALLYRILFLHGKVDSYASVPILNKHAYNLGFGLVLGYFCYGFDIIYSLISIAITYGILSTFKNDRNLALKAAFGFNIGYLLTAYFFLSSEEGYDIDWTTAQSVLCLRLISLAYDFADGAIPPEKLEADQKENGLKELPDFVGVLAYCYFYTGFFIGPQFTYNRYLSFLNGKMFKQSTEVPSPYDAAAKCFGLGLVYLIFNTISGIYFTSDYWTTDAFADSSFLYRLIYHFITCYVVLSKYLGVWLIGEGSSVLCGIGYAGKSANGETNWHGLANVNPLVYETSPTITGVVQSFNINTNDWSKRYIFKRLRFLGNKDASLILTTLFLALWHGLAPGYFLCFGLEFFALDAEKRLGRIFASFNESIAKSNDANKKLGYHVLCQFLRMVTIYFALGAFIVKSASKSFQVWRLLGYWFFVVYIIIVGADMAKLGNVLFGKQRKE